MKCLHMSWKLECGVQLVLWSNRPVFLQNSEFQTLRNNVSDIRF
jgi:hypothetical protein